MDLLETLENETLASLKDRAVESLNRGTGALRQWVAQVRDPAPGRFRWAIETTRGANVAATAYLLGGLKKMGILEETVTPANRDQGAAWVRSLQTADGYYRDPALYDRRSPKWPEDEPWPSPPMRLGVTQYARTVLHHYTGIPTPNPPPPDGWPQSDEPEKALEFIRTRPWDTNPWGAGSHAMRMAGWLLQWHKEGRLALDPAVEALRFFYEIQDPETGLWGGSEAPRFSRINGTFKLFPLIREQLDLPLPHAEKIIDQVLGEFYRSDYDEKVGGCDEWDNWYVVALAMERTDAYRRDGSFKLAAYRIARVLEIFQAPDGGLSYAPGRCAPNWIGFDMAPAIGQGDVMGPGILAGGINVCIDLLGLHDASPWTGVWRMRETEAPDLRDRIEALVFGA